MIVSNPYWAKQHEMAIPTKVGISDGSKDSPGLRRGFHGVFFFHLKKTGVPEDDHNWVQLWYGETFSILQSSSISLCCKRRAFQMFLQLLCLAHDVVWIIDVCLGCTPSNCLKLYVHTCVHMCTACAMVSILEARALRIATTCKSRILSYLGQFETGCGIKRRLYPPHSSNPCDIFGHDHCQSPLWQFSTPIEKWFVYR